MQFVLFYKVSWLFALFNNVLNMFVIRLMGVLSILVFCSCVIGGSVDSVSIMGSVMGGGSSVLGSVAGDRKVRLAEVTLARERDFGINDVQFVCVSHLGNILREGDVVLG